MAKVRRDLRVLSPSLSGAIPSRRFAPGMLKHQSAARPASGHSHSSGGLRGGCASKSLQHAFAKARSARSIGGARLSIRAEASSSGGPEKASKPSASVVVAGRRTSNLDGHLTCSVDRVSSESGAVGSVGSFIEKLTAGACVVAGESRWRSSPSRFQ